MIKMKKSTLIKTVSLIGILLIGIVVVIMVVFSGQVKIPVSKSVVTKVLSEKVPLERTIEIQKSLPIVGGYVSKYMADPIVTVNKIKTEFEENKIKTTTTGTILIGDKLINFNVKANGRPVYRVLDNHSFYFLADTIKMDTDNPPSKLMRDYILKKVKESENKRLSTKDLEKEEMSDEPKKLFSFMDKAKNIMSKTKEEVIKKTKNVVEKTKDFKEDLYKTSIALLNEPHHRESINHFVLSNTEKQIIKYLNEQPIYSLKDNFKENTVKISLKQILITEQGFTIVLSLTKIFWYIVLLIGITISIGVLIYYILKSPKQVFFGFIELTANTVGVIAEGAGAVASGLGEGLGNL